MITVERADFVSVPVQDMERAKRFYSETLGIHSPNLDDGWPEFETGSVSIYLVDPTQIGAEFKPHGSHIALRVPDVQVTSGDTVDLGTLRVQRAVTRSGTVVTAADHAPVANAQVLVALDGADALPRKLQADAGGRFDVTGLASDQPFRLRAEAGTRSSGWVTVAPGGDPIELDVNDTPTGALSGVVVDAAQPVQNRLVVLTLVEPGVPGISLRIEASATADAGGRFRMTDVRAGEYAIWARGVGSELTWTRSPRTVTVEPQGNATVVVNAGGAR